MRAERFAEVLRELQQGMVEYDEERVMKGAKWVVEEGFDAYAAVMDWLAAGMAEVGRLFGENEYFVPEVSMAADALYAGLDILRPRIRPDAPGRVKGTAVIGTVEGDVHDIGKNMVKLLFEIAGFAIRDLGRDVPPQQFVAEVVRTEADFLCLSAMMTTTMGVMQPIIQEIREKRPNVKIMVGGAPLTADLANRWGADGYGKDAPNALAEALRLLGSLREMSGGPQND
jgi:methanogenic corrinoid protein MtbC1